MNRRDFIKDLGFAAGVMTFPGSVCRAASIAARTYDFQTRHVVWVINGSGARKTDWYQNPALCPNLAQLANEAFVYEESHNDTVCNHELALAELLSGNSQNPLRSPHPSVLDYLGEAYKEAPSSYWCLTDQGQDTDPLAAAVHILREFKPRLIICQITAHDAGHGNNGYARLKTGQYEYFNVCRTTDEQVGRIVDFVKRDAYFSGKTAIVIRPEFGRDDEPNMYGELHHSEGFYQTHRSAEIWWGPDFKVGVDKGLKNRRDFAPSLLKLFNVNATDAMGQVHPEMFKASLGVFPPYMPSIPT